MYLLDSKVYSFNTNIFKLKVLQHNFDLYLITTQLIINTAVDFCYVAYHLRLLKNSMVGPVKTRLSFCLSYPLFRPI